MPGIKERPNTYLLYLNCKLIQLHEIIQVPKLLLFVSPVALGYIDKAELPLRTLERI